MDFKVGDRVTDPIFGDGTVAAVSKVSTLVDVKFKIEPEAFLRSLHPSQLMRVQDEKLVTISYYEHDCEWTSKFCDEHHLKVAAIPQTVLDQYEVKDAN